MDLSPFNYDASRNTVVVLGAGATRGADLDPVNAVVKPPMDLDFFDMLRSSSVGRTEDARRLLDLIESEFGSLTISMERFYSQAFLHDLFVSQVPDGKKGRIRRFEMALKYFRRVLPLIFAEALEGRRCRYHERLAGALSAKDSLISFNYDCLMDRALGPALRRRWMPASGYGFTINDGLEEWQDHSGSGPHPKRSFLMLKPHGSLNWSRHGNTGWRLRADEYARRDADELEIIPPLMQKNFDSEPYNEIWSQARRQLSTTRSLIVVGYSLPETDVYTQAAFRIDVDKLDFLTIVNPDDDARARILDTLQSAITSRTHVVQLRDLEALAAVLPKSEAELAEEASALDYLVVDGGTV